LPAHARRRPARWAAVAATTGLAVYAAALLIGARHVGFTSSDTAHLVLGTRVALGCIRRGVWTRCAYPDNSAPFAHLGRASTVRQFALLQYLPAAVLVKSGLSDSRVIAALRALNSVAFIATAGLVGAAGRRALGRGWGYLLMAVIVVGPLAFYSVASFSEMLAACMATLAVVAALWRRPVLLGVSMAVACIGKETFAPFLVVLACVVGRDDADGLLPPARVVLPAVGGAAVGIAADAAFNIFRFGTPLNRTYLDPTFVVPGTRLKASFSLAMWLSPNAGLLWFWPLATLLLVAVLVGSIALIVRRRLPARSLLPVAATVAVTAAFTWGLGSFVAPFGWVAWGPRLLLPLIPAILLAAVVGAPRQATAGIGRMVGTWGGVAAFCLLLVASAVTQVGAVWNFQAAERQLYTPDRVCAEPGVIVQFDPVHYYRCIQDVAWRTGRLVLPTAGRPAQPAEEVAVIAVAIGGIGLALLGRRDLRSPAELRRVQSERETAAARDQDGMGQRATVY
jgi:hypothetical protein